MEDECYCGGCGGGCGIIGGLEKAACRNARAVKNSADAP